MLSSALLAVLISSLIQATTPWLPNVPQPPVTYCTSTLTVQYPTPCTQLCASTVTKTVETTSVSCEGYRYLTISTAAPEGGLYCPVRTSIAFKDQICRMWLITSCGRLPRALHQSQRSGTMSIRLRRRSVMRRRHGQGRVRIRSMVSM